MGCNLFWYGNETHFPLPIILILQFVKVLIKKYSTTPTSQPSVRANDFDHHLPLLNQIV